MIRLAGVLLVLWVGGNLGVAAAQVVKARADSLAVTICEVSQDCVR